MVGEPNPGGSPTILRACVPCGPSGAFAKSIWYTTEGQSLPTDLEQVPRRVQLHHADLEALMARCMDEIFKLAKSGEDRERQMELAALEYRARLVLKRWKEQDRN